MATGKKDRPWDGRSRPSDDKYRKEFNRIGKSRVSNDLYHKRFDEIFKKEKTLHEELMEGFEKEQEELTNEKE